MAHPEASYDAIIVGAGYAGAVSARELAERGGMHVLVLESRDHIGGNAYDCYDDAGILIHLYGPHIYHTNDKRVNDYLCRFTEWSGYQHRVEAYIGGRYMPVPFNKTSMRLAFGEKRAAELIDKLIVTFGDECKVPIIKLREQDDADLSFLADYVYDNVFLRYTMKQWGQTPEQVDPSVTARVPVFISEDDRYFQDTYQGLPTESYTAMFERILDHPGITVECGVDARDRLGFIEDGDKVSGITYLGQLFEGPVIYTGPLDELFANRFGRLPYRSLDFDFQTLSQDRFQPRATINYTVSEDYTRITEFKQLTGQEKQGVTTIVYEYPRAYTGEDDQIPYYAILNPDNNDLHARYVDLLSECANFHALGRLAEYKYYNMDAICGKALELADKILA